MFCKECGKEAFGEAKFCSSCGHSLLGPKGSEELSTLILDVKPVFIPSVTIFSIIPVQLFMTVWGGMFFGGFGLGFVKLINLPLPAWSTFVFFACVFFFGLPILAYNAKKKTYAKTVYKFYTTKLEYYEGFFTVEEKTISYKKITEVSLRKGVFQRKYGLGSIFLSTPATGRTSFRSGIVIADIEHPDETYKRVKELIGSYS